jgi:pyridoxal 5'-phosphate synthase pdxT subunit
MPQEDGSIRIGVLALQGAFQAHYTSLSTSSLAVDLDVTYVRTKQELISCDGLVLPGGESTVMSRLLERLDLTSTLASFIEERPVFGTCAGLILLSHAITNNNKNVNTFSALDIEVCRNGYGSQKDSFAASIQCKLYSKEVKVEALFIRAPKIISVGENVDILASHQGDPVLVQQNMTLGATFHPELTKNREIHDYFIRLVADASRRKSHQIEALAL